MRRKTFVEYITSFISNMRVERPEDDGTKEESELAKWLKANIRYFIFDFDMLKENMPIVIELAKGHVEGEPIKFMYNEDLSESLQEAFLSSQPMRYKISHFEVNHIVYDVCWDVSVPMPFNNAGVMWNPSTEPIAIVNRSTMKPISFKGTCTFKAPNEEAVEGIDAVAKIIEVLFMSGELEQVSITADITVDGTTFTVPMLAFSE